MRTIAAGCLVLAAHTISGCAHKVALSHTAPAEIELGKQIERVLLVDQSNQIDIDARNVALQTLATELQKSERFDAVVTGRSDVRPRDIREMCEKIDCDAVISLEALTSEDFVEVEPRGGKNDSKPPVYASGDDPSVSASFRTVSETGKVLDRAELSVSPDALPGPRGQTTDGELLSVLATEVGEAYAVRIAPHPEIGVRTLYASGAPELRLGVEQAESGQWKVAESTWREFVRAHANSPGRARDVAKARHNLAIAAERAGRLDRALQLARNADDVLNRARTSEYVLTLEQRWVDQRRIAKSMPKTVAAR